MGMFDSVYDADGNEWQTKAFDRVLAEWSIGDEFTTAASDFQFKVYGGPAPSSDAIATVRDNVLTAVPAERDGTLPLIDYQGGVLDVGSDGRVQIVNAVRSAYIEYQSTRDLHELARAVGNILESGGD
jgi:hypothetical protein